MKKIIFKDNYALNSPNDFSVHIQMANDKRQLLRQLNDKLLFPYFGFNWDALYDCLRDFNWVRQRKIIIIHDDLPKIERHSLKIYINILIDAMNDWKEGEEHSLDIIFPKQYEQEIASLLNDNDKLQ